MYGVRHAGGEKLFFSFCSSYKGEYTSKPLELTTGFWKDLRKLEVNETKAEPPETENLFKSKRIGLGRRVRILAGQHMNRNGKVIGKDGNLFQVVFDNGTVVDVPQWDVVKVQ